MDFSAGDFLTPKTEVTFDRKEMKIHHNDYQIKLDNVSKELIEVENKIADIEKKRLALSSKTLLLEQELIEEKAKYRQDIDVMIEKRSQIPFELQGIPSQASFDLIYDGRETFEDDLIALEKLNILDDDSDIDLDSIKKSVFNNQLSMKEKCMMTMKEIREHLKIVHKKCDEQLETLSEIESSCMTIE